MDRVVTAAGTLYTVPCEAVFDTHPKVRRTALVGVPDGDASRPVLCVELEPDEKGAERGSVATELLEIGARHAHTRDIRSLLFHKSFPVDIRHNAKIGRAELARFAARRLRSKRWAQAGSASTAR